MKKIIVYTTDTWPHCKTAKAYLREKGFSFIEKDINKDSVARNDFTKRGLQGVPTFLIGNDIVEGLDTRKIESLVDYKVESCPNCKAKLRIPKGKGKINITCPKCEFKYQKET